MRKNKWQNIHSLLAHLFRLDGDDGPAPITLSLPPRKKDHPQYHVAPNMYPHRYPNFPYQAWIHRLESDSSRLFSIGDLVVQKRDSAIESEESSRIHSRLVDRDAGVGNQRSVDDVETSDCGAAAHAPKDVAGLGTIG